MVNLKVMSLFNWTFNKTWNLKIIEPYCPEFIIRKIISTLIPNIEREDKMQWAFDKIGKFNLKSAYNWLLEKRIPM